MFKFRLDAVDLYLVLIALVLLLVCHGYADLFTIVPLLAGCCRNG